MKTFTRSDYFKRCRLRAHKRALDWKREHELDARRERALVRIIARHFERGGFVAEGFAFSDSPRRPGFRFDTLHDPRSLARLIARRAFGWGGAVSLL